MIHCKCECINNKYGECKKDGIVMGLSGCLSIRHQSDNVYSKVINYFGSCNQNEKAVEEMNELSDALIGHGDIAEELADNLNMFEQLKMMHGVSNEDLHSAMESKMKRTLERIQKEQAEKL